MRHYKIIQGDFVNSDRQQAVDGILCDRIVSQEFANFFLGDYLGFGCSRHVFEFAMDKRWVIKIEQSHFNANVLEFDVWERIQYMSIRKWFAPIKKMSRCGRVLMMRQANMKVDLDLYPKKIPALFTDIKLDNFGFIGKQFVCVDYASNLCFEKGVGSRDMRKVNWHKTG